MNATAASRSRMYSLFCHALRPPDKTYLLTSRFSPRRRAPLPLQRGGLQHFSLPLRRGGQGGVSPRRRASLLPDPGFSPASRKVLSGVLSALTLLIGSVAAQAQPRLHSWGHNGHLQLGNGTGASRNIPGDVKAPVGSSALSVITALRAGKQHVLAVRSDGTVYAWGANGWGQLGNNTTAHSLHPGPVSGPGGVGTLMGVVAADGGREHSLALKSDGTLWAWGRNGSGQLGDDSLTQRLTPVQVKGPGGVGFLTDVAALDAGDTHSVVLRNDGTVWAWGQNSYGTIGDGATTTRDVPTQVHGPNNVGFLTDVAAIAGGNQVSLAVKTNGTVWAWGLNSNGQLGDGTTTNRTTPVQVLGPNGVGFLTNVVAVAGGQNHSLALKSDGTLWTWGYNAQGQLGDNTVTRRLTPVQVLGPGGVGFLTGVTAIAGGDSHSLARKSDGTVWAWGYNTWGTLGDGTTTSHRAPVQVVGPDGVGFLTDTTAVAGGAIFAAALKTDGTVWCWGYNGQGQLGNDTTIASNTPVRTVAPEGLGVFPDARAVVSGWSHTLVLKSDGTVYAFGYNGYGQLGDNTTTGRSVAVPVLGPSGIGALSDILAVAAGNYHSVALKADGTVWTWGMNNVGQLGDNTNTRRLTPVQVLGPNSVGFLTDIVAIAAGGIHTLALREDGTVFAWGGNGVGQLGDGTVTPRTTPVSMLNAAGTEPLRAMAALAAGDAHSLAMGANGGVFACGSNSHGQLGDGTTMGHSLPVQVLGVGGIGTLNSMVAISAGRQHSVALRIEGTVYTWGSNVSGQLGDNTTTNRLTPVQVVGPGGTGLLSDVAAVVAGRNHNLAIKFDGATWAWGDNEVGQLGDNTNETRLAPIQVLGPDGVGFLTNSIAIAAGQYHSVAIHGKGVVQGNVILQNSACSGADLRFEFRPQPDGAPIIRNIIAGPLGLFTFTDIPPGTYDVAVKGSKWLQRVAPDVNTNTDNVLNLRIFLLAGDANDDNSIDVLDLDVLIQAFDKVEGDPGWNMNADFNCDDSVDVLDLDLLIQNFDLQGDP
jgi:alpha-tubulin suppressor-like RCC1 family protein